MIQTQRLRLRQWQDADAEPFAAMNADPDVMVYFPALLSRQQSDEAMQRYQRHIAEHGWGFWAVERCDNGAFIGFVGLNVPNYPLPFAPCVEIGWRLSRHAWGQGYAAEAARASLHFGFESLALAEIVSFTSQHNQRSQAVMQRLGMQRAPSDDFLHPKLPIGHRLAAHVLYRLVASDWQQRAHT